MNKIYVGIGPNVLIREEKKEEKVAGLIIPDSLDVDFVYGEVVSCAEGYFDKSGFIPMPVVSGDKVMFYKTSGTKIKINNENLIRVYAPDIIAKEIDGKFVEE